LKIWTDGNLRECVAGVVAARQTGSKRVERYWKEGLGINNLTGCKDVAWSAAFICWCMRQAGMPLADFAYNSGHHAYIRWAINNTKQNKADKTYYGRRPSEYKPKPGDLVAHWRKVKRTAPDPNISFDLQPNDFYPSHCDIVVEVSSTAVVVVGGNVSQRVKKNTLPARGGIISPLKDLICVMECSKT
jgi:hypothetical protein